MAIRRMASSATRAMKYTAMEAVSDLAPTSIDIFRQARSGIEDTRNYMRTNMSKIKTHSKTALESGALGASFRHYLDTSVGEIRKGNLAIRDISKGIEDDFDRIMADLKSESNTDAGGSDADNAEIHAQHAVSAADLGGDDSMVRMMAATGTGTVEALRQLQGSMTQTQLSAAEYMTKKLSTVLFSQMSMQAKHYGIIENQLSAINKNLEGLVKYQANNQSAYIHANMTFFDEMSGYMSRAEQEKKAALRDAKKNKRRKSDGFLADRHMNLTQYKDIVRDNFKNSEAGMAFSMLTGIDMDYFLQGVMDGIDPRKLAGKAALGMLMPKKVRRSIRRSDDMLNTMLKSGMARLGSYQYDMKNHPILGMLGSIFGIDTRLSRKTQLGKFNHGERTWNGEAQRALVNVIPKYLAEVSANTRNQSDMMNQLVKRFGIRHKDSEAAFYDMETGTYQTKAQARTVLQKKIKDAKENPFANIFNAASLDPDEILDRDLWKSMSSSIQDQISTLMNTAVDSVDGMTAEMNQQLQDLLKKGLKRGDKDIDVDRMMAKLVQSAQQSRQNIFNLIEQLQSGETAFSQIAPELANEWGTIEYDDLMKFLGRKSRSRAERERTGINLRDANSGKYSIKGRNYDLMGEDAKARAKGASDMVRDLLAQAENLPNSQNPAARRVGQLLQTMMYGRRRGAWADTASGAVDRATAEVFDLMMGTGRHFRRGPSGGGGGSGGSGGSRGPAPNLDDTIQNAADLASAGARTAANIAGATARTAAGAASSSASKAKDAARGGIGAALNAGRKFRISAQTRIHDAAVDAVGGIRNLVGHGDREESNIVNQSFQESASGGPDAAQTTADATSQMRDTVEEAFGKKGYMAKLYNSPLIQKMWKTFAGSAAGKAAGAAVGSAKDYVGSLFTEDYVDEETGEVVESFATKMKKLASPATSKLKGALGVKDSVEETAEVIASEGEKLKEGMEATREAVVGDESPDKQKQSIMNAMATKFRKSGTKIATGAALGVGASILAGGKMGLIGSMFLPGGPFGMAILGSALSLAWKSDAFQRVVFGEDDGNGNKTGGLISDKLQKSFKKNLPTFAKGAAAGIGIKLAAGLLGGGGGGLGALPAMFAPGGLMGAAIMGSAGAFMLRNEKVQDILFGPEKDGKRSGTILSNMYNKVTGKIQGLAGGNSDGLKKKLKAVGIGAAAGAAMSHMGLLGSALSFGGPIGGAIVGSAMGMAAMTPKFQRWLFGDEDPDNPGKRKNNGLLSRVANAIDLNIVEPMAGWLGDMGQSFALFVREKFETPIRILLSPLKDLAEVAKDTATSAIELMIDTVGNKVAGVAKAVIEGVGGKFFKYVLMPMAKVGGGLAKTGLFGAMHLAAAPLNFLAGGFEKFSKTGRKANKGIKTYLKGVSVGDIIANRRAAAEEAGEKYGFFDEFGDTIGAGLAKTPLLRRFARNTDVMRGAGGIMEGARDTTDSASTREILDAKVNQFKFHNQRKDLKKESRVRKKRDKKRRSMAKSLNYTRGADISEDDYAALVTEAKDLGYDIKTRGELDDFIFDFNSFKQKKEQKENREAGKLNDIEDNNVAELDAHQKSRHEELMDVMREIAHNTSTTADVGKAQLDLDSGTVMDTSDLSNAGNRSSTKFSDKVDEGVTKRVLEERKESTSNAFAEALGAMRKDDEDKVRLENLRGNDSGNADDDSVIRAVRGEDSTPKEKKKSFLETILGLFTGGGGLSSLLTGAGIAGLAAMILGNEDIRNAILNVVTDAGSAILNVAVDAAGEAAKNLPETAGKIYNTAMGKDGGVNNSRATKFDDEGNVTETVSNSDLTKHTVQALSHPIKTLKAIPSVLGIVPKTLSSIAHPVRTFENIAGKLTGQGAKTVTKAAANSFDDLIKLAVNSSDDVFRAAVTAASSSTDDIIKAGLNSTDDAVRAAANTAKAAAENKGLFAKCINMAVNALKSAAEGNGRFARLAGGAVNIGTKMKALISTCDDIVLSIVEKGIKSTHSEMLEAAYAQATANMSTGAATAGAVTAVLALAGGIDGYLSAAHLFKVDPTRTTAKMNLISTVWGAACGASGIACVVAVVNDIIREFTGVDFVCIAADFLYDLISNDKEKEIRDFGRQYLGTQTDVYNEINSTKISDQAYNDIRNRSWMSKAWDAIIGRVSDDTERYAASALEIERQNPTTTAEAQQIIQDTAEEYNAKKNALIWANRINLDRAKIIGRPSKEDIALATNILKNLDASDVEIQVAELNSRKNTISRPSSSELAKLGLTDTGAVKGGTKDMWVKASNAAPVYVISNNTAHRVGRIENSTKVIVKNEIVIVGGDEYYELNDSFSSSKYTIEADKSSAWYTPKPGGCYVKTSSLTDTRPSTNTRMNRETNITRSGSTNPRARSSNNTNRSTNHRMSGLGGRTRGGELVGYGPNTTLTQNDPKWSNLRIGTLPSGRPSTMADGGCGPTALANAANSLGGIGNPATIAKYASDNGMISQGGATTDLFDKGAKAFGLNSKRVKGSRNITDSLRQGKPVILAGKGAGSDAPFTNAGHIVTATGIDSKGNVTIQDPQRQGQYKYKLSDVQRKMTGGWEISNGAKQPAGYGLISDILGGFNSIVNKAYELLGIQRSDVEVDENGNPITGTSAFGNTAKNLLSGALSSWTSTVWNGKPLDPTESKGRIWNYLRTKVGMSEEAAAGMMGCWEVESHNRADRLEGDYVKGFPKVEDAMASNAALNDYFLNYLYPAYKRKGKSIKVSAYKGNDGNYYPGIGLAQWTGPRGERLLNLSKETGMDWRDLYAQLNYAMTEFGERKNSDKIFAAKSPSEGAYLALSYYEMSKKWADSHPKQLKNRQDQANAIYATYKGSLGISQVPTRADNTFQADPNIVPEGVYSMAKGKHIYNGKGEKVMTCMKDSKIVTKGGVEINNRKYAVVMDYDGYFEPISRTGPKSPVYYFAQLSDLVLDRSLSITNFKNVSGLGGITRGGKPVGYGIFDTLSGGFDQLKQVVYDHFGLNYSSDGMSTDGTTSSNSFFSNFANSFATSASSLVSGVDDSTIYGGSLATGNGFVPRLSRPTAGNKYYITKSAGGYSDAVQGKPTDSQNNVLHNCVGYAFGRFNEIIGDPSCSYLRPVNAEQFMNYKGNLETGAVPRVGAVAVWSKGSKNNPDDGAGHVAIVEKVLSPTEVITSESGWKASKPFWTQNRSKGQGNWGQGSAYNFQGFIYNPAPSCQPTEADKASGYGGKRSGYDEKLGPFGAIFNKKDEREESTLGEPGIGTADNTWSISHNQVHGHDDSLLTAGYGDVSHDRPNAGVENRLDRIITILDRIAKNGEKRGVTNNAAVNVNYGTGGHGDPQPEVIQPVVIQKQDKEVGEHDSLHSYSRSIHRKLASKDRFL